MTRTGACDVDSPVVVKRVQAQPAARSCPALRGIIGPGAISL